MTNTARLEHHPDCNNPLDENSPVTAGCVPDCPVRGVLLAATDRRNVAASALELAERELGAAALELAWGRIAAALDAQATDAVGLVDFGGRWIERDRIAAGIRLLLGLPAQAESAVPVAPISFSAPTVAIGRPRLAPDSFTAAAPFHEDLVAMAAGELPLTRVAEIRAHMADCAKCRTDYVDVAALGAQLSTEEPGAPDVLTLEKIYPVTVPYLEKMRDVSANPFDRIDAAKWLLESGFADHELMRDDVRAAARGDLPGVTSLELATDASNRTQVIHAELDAVIAELKASGEVMVDCQPMYDRLATRLAARVGKPVVITQHGVPAEPGERVKLRVRALGVEVVH